MGKHRDYKDLGCIKNTIADTIKRLHELNNNLYEESVSDLYDKAVGISVNVDYLLELVNELDN